MNKLSTFIDFFKYLGYTVPNRPESKMDKVIEMHMNETLNFNIYHLIEEIEKDLGRHTNPKLFIQRILLRFENISKFLLINLEKEYTTSLGKEAIIINETTYYEDHIFTHKTLERYFCWYRQTIDNVDNLNVFQRYVIDCFHNFDNFFSSLDKLCLDYDIDILQIQEEKNIIVWIRKLNSLLENENTPKLKSIVNTKLDNSSEITKVKKEETSILCIEDFLFNPSDNHKIPLIVEKFKNEKGKSMAIAIYLLRELNIFNYELNSKTKGRANLTKLLNPNIRMNGVNMHFSSNTYDLQSLHDDDLNQTRQWLNGL